MSDEAVTASQVAVELKQIIRDYPDRTGKIAANESLNGCVYYLDEKGRPVTSSLRPVTSSLRKGVGWSADSLKTPICIVAMWIEQFHPKLKHVGPINHILVNNNSIRVVVGNEADLYPYISKGAIRILNSLQQDQDLLSGDLTWKDLDLDLIVEYCERGII